MIIDSLPADSSAITVMMWGFGLSRPVVTSIEERLQRILDALEDAGYTMVKSAHGTRVCDDEFKAQATFPRELLRTVVWRAYQGVCDRDWPVGELPASYCPDCGQIWVWHTLTAVSEREKRQLIRASFALLEAGYRFRYRL